MKEISILAVLTIVLGLAMMSFGAAGAQEKSKDNPIVVMKTTMGDIAIELYPDKAPLTVKNFLNYVDTKFYEGLIFHRVMSNFMIQGGGFTKDMVRKEGGAPIQNEADNKLSNEKGTVAMARTNDPHSATSQFFINLKDNDFLDHGARDFGYAVFGRVVDGMGVVDKIAATPTTSRKGHRDVPVEPIIIHSARRE